MSEGITEEERKLIERMRQNPVLRDELLESLRETSYPEENLKGIMPWPAYYPQEAPEIGSVVMINYYGQKMSGKILRFVGEQGIIVLMQNQLGYARFSQGVISNLPPEIQAELHEQTLDRESRKTS